MRRFRITIEGTRFDLSPFQCLMLSRKRLKLTPPVEWNDQQRIVSLVKQGLFRKRNGSYERTKLGSAVYLQITAKVAEATQAAPKE